MPFLTIQLASARQSEWLREADRARLTTSARAARRPARHSRLAATAPGEVIRAIFLRPAA